MEAELNASLPCFSNSLNLTLYKIKFECSFLTINLTSCTPIQSAGEINTITVLCQATSIVWDVGFWFAVVVGLIGNGLAIFTIASLPKSTCTFYVGLLAVSDLSALCIRGAIDVLIEHSIITHRQFYSNFVAMVFDYCASYSNWLLVLIGLERLLTMRFPLQKRSILTLRRAQVSALVLALVLLLAYGLAFSTLDYEDAEVFGVRNMLYAVLPLALNSVIIILISCQLRRAQRTRERILTSHSRPRSVLITSTTPDTAASRRSISTAPGTPSAPPSSTVTSPNRHPTTLQNIAHLENSITVMMLVAAVCFFLLTMPNCVLLYSYEYVVKMLMNAPVYRARWLLLSRVTELLTFLNLSVNFVLYFLSAKKFRSHLYRVLTPKSWSIRSAAGTNFGGNWNNTNSHNSVNVFRAIQLYRLSEDGSETLPLKYRQNRTAGKVSTAAVVAGTHGDRGVLTMAATADVSTDISPGEATKRSDLSESLTIPHHHNTVAGDDISSGSSRESGVDHGFGGGSSGGKGSSCTEGFDRENGSGATGRNGIGDAADETTVDYPASNPCGSSWVKLRTLLNNGSVTPEKGLVEKKNTTRLVAELEGHVGKAL
ncbi:thyrotropin-releasing hormone receptor [Elysia marginata]|uniref:Thyrotropin-releasing hormone receptor n=1 Tax=Elysia marginata TaxID=1093978 RepID=A0AAV4FYC0_9GAST|nr:thyrotropin-releasing hormone receptor [Elysia marginata]